MTAFIPIVPSTSFTTTRSQLPRTTSPQRPHAPRMAYDPNGPSTSKYLSTIPADRLNKAPVITINAFSNSDLNSVSVRLADLPADQGAGDSLKAGIVIDDEPAPDPAKYAAYYDPQTINEAPFISLYSSADGLPLAKWGLALVQTVVPTRLDLGAQLLGDVPPDPKDYANFAKGLNMAPDITAEYGTCNEDSNVTVDMNEQFLPYAAAAEIFAKYRS